MRFASLLRNRRTDQAFKMSRLYATVAHAKREGHEAPCLLHSRLHRSHFMKWLLYLFCRAEYGGGANLLVAIPGSAGFRQSAMWQAMLFVPFSNDIDKSFHLICPIKAAVHCLCCRVAA